MEVKEFAEMLNGCEEITTDNGQLAKDNYFVIVTGASDDIMSFDGSISDEGDCNDGGTVRFTKETVLSNWEEIEEAIDTLENNGIKMARFHTEMDINEIEALWCPEEVSFPDGTRHTGVSWEFKTDIPHERFKMYEDGEVYSAGLVFKISDLK